MKKPTRRGLGLSLLTVGLAGALAAVTMLPGSATPPVNGTSTILARGTDVSPGTLRLHMGADVVVAVNTFEPGGSSGWHSHPGGAIVVIVQGEITLYRSEGHHCRVTTYTPGQSFIERSNDVQNGVNTGKIQTILYAIFPSVTPAGGSPRTDVATDPGTCPGV